MKKLVKNLILILSVSLLIGSAAPVLAYYPTMSVYSSGSDNSITISGGQPDAAVVINFTPSGSSLPTTITGTTDVNGNFTTDVGSVSSQITATVAGQQVVNNGNNEGCTYNCGTSYGLSLSQTSLSLSVGQSSSIAVYGSGSYYISGNSNSSIASVTLSGSQIAVYGETSGSSSISICSSGADGVCATLYVTVTGSSCIYDSYNCGSGSLSLSQTSLSLSQGQTSNVAIYNNGNSYGNYYISNNSNISVASASISGSSVLVSALAAGNTTISVCQNSNSQCVSLYVTVSLGSCGYYGCGTLSLSQTSLNLGQGQSSDVIISGGGSYYISSNSNSSAVSASISGSTLLLTGIYTGGSTITVCQSSGSSVCASVYVTVNGTGTGGLSLSQTSLNLSTGQSATVSAYNYSGGYLYISSNSNSGVALASVSGSVITLYALGSGSSTVIVCGGSSSQCGSIYVTVNGSGSSGSLYLSQTNLSLNQGQSSNIIISGSGSYYISTNSNLSVVSATISGSSLFLSALESGSSTVTVCQSSGYSGCASVYVTVNGGSGGSAVYFSPGSVSLSTGQNTSVVISSSYNNGYNGYYISNNSNSYVVTATISGSSLNLYGQTAGNSSITVCQSSGGGCGTLYVTVGTGYYSGSITLSQTSLTLTSGQTDSVNIYGSGSYYISTNSNPAIVSAAISGNVLNLYPSTSAGTSTVTVCQSSGNGCASLYVTTAGYNGSGNGNGGLYFTTTTPLPLMTVGQYYNYQLQVSGGQAPYYYTLSGGSLPGGLSLSSGGLISGAPVYGGYQTFTVTVNDSYGHSATQNFSLGNSGSNPGSGLQYPGGGVLGASTYPNGELISQGGTVYIVYKNLETPFSNAAAFLGLGFSFSNVIPVANPGLQNSGYTVTTRYSQHPWGSWIKSGSTIYFVDSTGLIPVPNWNTFIQNGGQQNLIVPANQWDFRLSILTPMTIGDSRLQ